MANKWQIMVLGVVLVHGIGLSASEYKVTKSLTNSCGVEAQKDFVAGTLKRSLEKKASIRVKNSQGIGLKDIANLHLAEALKNDPRIGWLPI